MPLIRTALLKDFPLVIENDALNLRLYLETLRNTRHTIDNNFQSFFGDRSRLGLARVIRLKDRCRFSELRFLAGLPFFDGVDFISRHFETQTELGFQRDGIVVTQRSRVQQLALVKLSD